MIRIVIADDHPVVQRALAQLLDSADEISVVATASNGGEAVTAALQQSPDVVLMDLEMPGQDGIEATQALTAAGSEARVVILTTFSDRRRILARLTPAQLATYSRRRARRHHSRESGRGRRGCTARTPRGSRNAGRPRAARKNEPALSARELEVLRLVARGLPNKLIARELEISEKTVKAHLTSVFSQLGVSDRTQAALWAQRHLISD